MTAPILDQFVLSYVMAPLSPGFQFARVLSPKGVRPNHQIPMPVGVNMVSITCLSPSKITVKLSQPGSAPSIPQERLDIPAGSTPRTVVAEVPVLHAGSSLNLTMARADESDVDNPVIGVKVFPVPSGG